MDDARARERQRCGRDGLPAAARRRALRRRLDRHQRVRGAWRPRAPSDAAHHRHAALRPRFALHGPALQSRPGLPRRASRPRKPAAQGVHASAALRWSLAHGGPARLPEVGDRLSRARRASRRAPRASFRDLREVQSALARGQHEHPGNDDAFGLVHAEVNGEDFRHAPVGHGCGHEHGAGGELVSGATRALDHRARFRATLHAAPGRARASPGCPLSGAEFLGGVIGRLFAQASSTRSTRRRSISSRLVARRTDDYQCRPTRMRLEAAGDAHRLPA